MNHEYLISRSTIDRRKTQQLSFNMSFCTKSPWEILKLLGTNLSGFIG